MNRKVLMLIIYISLVQNLFSNSLFDELKNAQQNSEMIYGDSNALSISAGMFNDYSFNTFSIIIPLGNIYKIKPEIGIIYSRNEDIAGHIKISFQLGSPPSSNKTRIYGGPRVECNIPYTDISVGGFGGLEFFVNEFSSSYLEFGGLGTINSTNSDHTGFGTFFTGGLNFYL